MNRRFLLLFALLLIWFQPTFANNGGETFVTLCSGEKMSWEEYQLYKQLRADEYDLEIESYSNTNYQSHSFSFFSFFIIVSRISSEQQYGVFNR